MKTLSIYDRPDVQIPDFLQKILKEKGVKSFNLWIYGKEVGISLHVNLEKVTKVSEGEAHVPEAFEGITNITVVI